MKMQGEDQRSKWQPPPRPDWVQRINEEGDCMNAAGVVPLDSVTLLESARRTTGLSDFGANDWREPFEILCKSLEEDAELNLMGRIRTRSEMLQLLEARLLIEDTYKRHPEINDQVVSQPIFVLGQGRSGTSFLINLLAANPDNGAPLQWEMMFPCPPPEKATYRTDPRIARADKLIKQWTRVVPQMEAMHEFAGDLPLEDAQIFALNFMGPSWFGQLGQVSSYDAYIVTVDPMLGIRYHERVLKLLQWKNPRKNWVSKDCFHMDKLPQLMQVYPDACFVWPHRDPVRALASVVNLIGTVHWGRSDHPFKGGSHDEYQTDPEMSAIRLNAVIDQLQAGVVPEKQIHNLLYKELVGDTMGSLQKMHDHFGISFSEAGEEGTRRYLKDHPRDARPPHKVNLPETEIARARIAYKKYVDYFGVPVE